MQERCYLKSQWFFFLFYFCFVFKAGALASKHGWCRCTDLCRCDDVLIKAVLDSVAGHGMTVEVQPNPEHWGRRLMASESDNETEPKNCSEPGKMH